MSFHTNSSVYVAVLVLHPRRQKKVFEFRGGFPEGYFFIKSSYDKTVALPLMEARGLMSQEGVMYSSCWKGPDSQRKHWDHRG